MGLVKTDVVVSNPLDKSREFRFKALVDTGAAGLVLPTAWKEKLGNLPMVQTIQAETADQRIVEGQVAGPVTIQLDGFRAISSEVTFIDMQPRNGDFEPLVGFIVLEQSGASVDMENHRLVPLKYYLK